jgi:3-phenylpropionate/trans-cinnamate dioxygenase ferredoxin reductase subunit
VARTWDARLGRRACVESIDNAQVQGVAAGQNMAGKDTLAAAVPFFWSDQYDKKLQSVGHVGEFDRVVVRGSIAERAFVAFHLVEGRLAFAVGVNRMQEIGTAKKLIAAGAAVDAAQLEDPAFDLGTLVPKRDAPA